MSKYSLFDYLSFDPEKYAHDTGRKLLEIVNSKKPWKYKKLRQEVDLAFDRLLDLSSSSIDVVRVTKVWLSDYHIPIEPADLKSYDRFHERCNKIIMDSMYNNFSNNLKFPK